MDTIYLTFDDGPNEPYTSQILDILKIYKAKATFFVCGKCVERFPETAKRIAQEGHTIGNHTWSHSGIRSFIGLWEAEIEKTSNIVEKITGHPTTLFRPPWGRVTPLLRRYLEGHHYKLMLWDVEARDWEKPRARVIAQRIAKNVKTGSIILLHDGGGSSAGVDRSQTVAALSIVLRDLSAKRYTFDAL